MNINGVSVTADESTSRNLLLRIGERFEFEIYQDLQEFIFAKLGRPTVVYIRSLNNSLTACFPRQENRTERYRGFCTFCDKIRETTGIQGQFSPCVEYEQNFIKKQISLDEKGETPLWGWQICHMGLEDFYFPIRSQATSRIEAVLILGHGKPQGSTADQRIRSRIDSITIGDSHKEYHPEKGEGERRAIANLLNHAADSIPVLTANDKKEVSDFVQSSLNVFQFLADHSLKEGILFNGEQFVKDFELQTNDIHMTEELMNRTVHDSLSKVVEHFSLDSAVMYSSSMNDYTRLIRTAGQPSTTTFSDALSLSTYEEYKLIEDNSGKELSENHPAVRNIDIQESFSAKNVTIYARELIGGHLVVLGFGHTSTKLNSFKLAILHEVVQQKIFPFLNNALFGIELDKLMAECGHLMGRGIGGVSAGYKALMSVTRPLLLKTTEDDELVTHASYTMEDNIYRLRLVRANMYSFRRLRSGPANSNEDSASSTVDIVSILKSLLPFFHRSVESGNSSEQTRKGKDLKTNIIPSSALVHSKLDDRESVDRVELVLLNLFDNALKFSFNNTFIELHCSILNNTVHLDLSNIGYGVASDETERVFKPLARSRNMDPRKRIEGLGLGLPFCRRVVEEDLGGKIFLKSVLVGRSTHSDGTEPNRARTTISVRIPICESDLDFAI